MKNIFILIVLFFNTMLFSGTLKDFYLKNRVLDISAAPAFGKTDWESLVLLNTFYIAVNDNGVIFLSNYRDNKIIKLSPDGEILLTFGRGGQGPGDLEDPTNLGVLDNQYLVVYNSRGDHRISIFDFDGKFKNSFRCRKSNFNCIALRDGQIAFTSLDIKKNTSVQNRFDFNASLYLRNLNNPEEKLLDSAQYRNQFIKDGRAEIFLEFFSGKEFVRSTPQGNLLFGVTTSNMIKLYSPAGSLIKSFLLKIQPIPVTRQYIEAYRDNAIKSFKEKLTSHEDYLAAVKPIRNADLSGHFQEYLPLYSNAFMDPEGNLLVFKWRESPGQPDTVFQVYTPDGALLCENLIKSGKVRFSTGTSRQNLAFSNKNLILLVEKKTEDGDSYVQLIRIPTGAGPSR